MESANKCLEFLVFLLCLSLASSQNSKSYIVCMGSSENTDPQQVAIENENLLASVMGNSLNSVDEAKQSMMYSYANVFKGFAAQMTESQAVDMLSTFIPDKPEVVIILPNLPRKLQTTRSWEFMGFKKNDMWDTFEPENKAQENVIIGVIDTGIWPESPSFSDVGMSPVPSKWKGTCQNGQNFTSSNCNRKIIGARYYRKSVDYSDTTTNGAEFISARDSAGHGTHTASTAAGRYVPNMRFGGLVRGGSRGGAPLARLAIYKACWGNNCFDADILAAFDDAIRDGVDVLSLSLGMPSSNFLDSVSIGSFHAVGSGITVVCAGGNTGDPGSVENAAQWIITVAATSTDRDFYSNITAGNMTFKSLTTPGMNFSAPVALDEPSCYEGALNSSNVGGKVVVCYNYYTPQPLDQAKAVKDAGGVGLISISSSDTNEMALNFAVPTSFLGSQDGDNLVGYLRSTNNTQSFISKSREVYNSRPAPQVASFSSRGPSLITPDILKPDVAAPGVNILAAWTPAQGGLNYNVETGTSMACPHVGGIAALIKAANPSWSPSALHSAIVTTANPRDTRNQTITVFPSGKPGTPFDFGAGQVNPRSLNPGLVYEAGAEDYASFLCSALPDKSTIQNITVVYNTTCSKAPTTSPSNLNYPSIAIANFRGNASVERVVTNVGSSKSTYKAMIVPPQEVRVRVVPDILEFGNVGQKLKFTVHFEGKVDRDYVFGSLSWVSAAHTVTSPLAFGPLRV